MTEEKTMVEEQPVVEELAVVEEQPEAEELEAVEEQLEVEEPVEAEVQPRRPSKISDPASMKTDEEITAQIKYVKYITTRASIVIAIASALIILGVVFGK